MVCDETRLRSEDIDKAWSCCADVYGYGSTKTGHAPMNIHPIIQIDGASVMNWITCPTTYVERDCSAWELD